MECVSVAGADSVFECTVDGCGRSLVIDREQRRVTVVRQGNNAVPHSGASGPVMIAAEVDPS